MATHFMTISIGVVVLRACKVAGVWGDVVPNHQSRQVEQHVHRVKQRGNFLYRVFGITA